MTIGRRRAVEEGVNAASIEAPALGARTSFDEVVAEQLDAVYGYLVYLTGDRTAAEDLTAETFEKAFRTWRRFNRVGRTRRARGCARSRTTSP